MNGGTIPPLICGGCTKPAQGLVHQKAAKVDANLRDGLQSIKMNLLPSRCGGIDTPRDSRRVVANDLYLVLGLEKFCG
jgi:hypothetical protein